MLIQVDTITTTKSGKGYMVNGKYFAGLKTGIEQAGGKQIDALMGSFKSTTGALVETIESFTISTAQPAPQAVVARSNGISSVDRWWLPFVSNQCAHAIAAGLITSGEDLIKWAQFAKLAAIACEKHEVSSLVTDTSPDVPF